MGKSRHGDERRTDHVGVEDVEPRVRIHIGQANEGADARSVDEGVDAAKTLRGFVPPPLAASVLVTSQVMANVPRTRLRGGCLESLLPPGQQGGLSPALGEPDTDATPEPARSRHDNRAHVPPLIS